MRKMILLVMAVMLLAGCTARVDASSGPNHTHVGGRVDVNVLKW